MLKQTTSEVKFELDILKAQKTSKKGDYVVVGYAMTYDIDSDNTIISKTAIESAKDDLLEYSTVLFNHDVERPIGKVVETEVDEIGLLIKVVISKEEKEIWNKVKEGVINKFSIKGRATDFEEIDGRKEEEEKILKINKLELFETSLVTVPANVKAQTISWYVSKALNTNMLDKVKTKTAQSFDFSDESDTRPVFQLNNGPSEIVLEDDSFRKQILKLGKWHYWGIEGGILDVTKDKIAMIVKNFKANVLDHVSIPLTHTNDPSKNTGEITELIPTKDGLDAICKIKDKKVLGKITAGLIKSISPSIDTNYQDKESGKFVGPVLLHTALVHQPYIKGMRDFVELSDEFKGRTVIQLEDSELTTTQTFEVMKDVLSRIEDLLIETKKIVKDKDDEETEEKTDKKTKEIKDETEGFTDVEKSAYTECIKKETKAGKSVKDAAGICKKQVKKTIEETEEEDDESESTEESTETAKQGAVELADAEKVYDRLLKEGKLVPSQKEAVLQLLTSNSEIVLGDDVKVGVKETIISFLENQAKVINFEESGTVEADKPTSTEQTETPAVMPADVREFYTDKMDLSDEQAEKAWKDAKDEHIGSEKEKSTIFE